MKTYWAQASRSGMRDIGRFRSEYAESSCPNTSWRGQVAAKPKHTEKHQCSIAEGWFLRLFAAKSCVGLWARSSISAAWPRTRDQPVAASPAS